MPPILSFDTEGMIISLTIMLLSEELWQRLLIGLPSFRDVAGSRECSHRSGMIV